MIDMDSVENIESGISKILKIKEVELHNKIYQWYGNCYDEAYCNDLSFWDESKNYIEGKEIYFEEDICFYHLARTIEPVSNKLLNLRDLTTSSNTFSDFLSSNDIEIKWIDNMGHLIVKGNEFIIDKKKNGLLGIRLGQIGQAEPDTCINGFLFEVNLSKGAGSYMIKLERGPEILSVIDDAIGSKLCDDYRKSSKYYVLKIKANIQDLLFDNMDFKDKKSKSVYYIQCCMKFLAEYYRYRCVDNIRFCPTVRLHQNQNAGIISYKELK